MRPARRTRTPAPTTPPGDDTSTTWTAERILSLGATTDLATAAAILGISRSAAYKLVARDAFPVPLFRAGVYYRVPTAPILRKLHLDPPAPSIADGTGQADGGEAGEQSDHDRTATDGGPPL